MAEHLTLMKPTPEALAALYKKVTGREPEAWRRR
jgi:hypothetical protein